VRHKPLCHVEVTILACQQKGCVAVLITPQHIAKQKHRFSQHNQMEARTHNDSDSTPRN
jgi:hypothetical protein